MAVKINAKILGINKPIEVKESNRNLKLAMKLQIKFAKNSEIDSDDALESINGLLEIEEATTEFISTVLRLNEKQQEELEDLDQEETGDLLQEVLSKLLHLDETEDEDNGEPVKK